MRARVFAALELPVHIKQSLTELMEDFSARVPRGSVRWVRPEGIHLTLKFYGEVPMERLGEIEAGLRQAAANAGPLRLGLEGLGVFPNRQRPQVLWVGVNGDLEALHALQAAVEAMSEGLGFTPEAREYQAHLTLGRVGRDLPPSTQLQLREFLNEAHVPPLGEFQAETLSLMRSHSRPGGSTYTALFVMPLGAGAAPEQPGQGQ